jgi:general secretion pathway protein J
MKHNQRQRSAVSYQLSARENSREKRVEPKRTVLTAEGFTLLEVVIAFVILTLVMLGIGQGLYISQNAWDKGEAETGETQRLRILSRMFSQQLKSAYPYKVTIDNENVVLFEGEEDSILFVTTMTDETYGGFKWVRYSFRDGALFYKEGLLPDKEVTDHIEEDEELLDDEIESVKFEYQLEDDEWGESWEFSETMPRSVKITVSSFEPFQVNIAQASRLKKDDSADEG